MRPIGFSMYGLRLSVDGGILRVVVVLLGNGGEGVDEMLVVDSLTVCCEGCT